MALCVHSSIACYRYGSLAIFHWPTGWLDLPPLPAGVTYTQVSLGRDHYVLLRSDGTAVAFGSNNESQCDIPVLPHRCLGWGPQKYILGVICLGDGCGEGGSVVVAQWWWLGDGGGVGGSVVAVMGIRLALEV